MSTMAPIMRTGWPALSRSGRPRSSTLAYEPSLRRKRYSAVHTWSPRSIALRMSWPHARESSGWMRLVQAST
jgi:hypothetical protein